MANDTSTGYASNWNVANINGAPLWTPSITEHPFLSRVAGVKVAASDRYAMASNYALESFSSTGITEAASVTAPTAVSYDRANEINYIQIFHKAAKVTYQRSSSLDRLKFPESGTSGFAYASAPVANAIDSEIAFQIARAEEQLMGDYETACLTGTAQAATSAAVASQIGGIVTGCTSNTVAASSAVLEKGMVNELLREMATSGARFQRGVIFANAFQKQKLSDIYIYVPQDRNRGGGAANFIETDFGVFEVVFCRTMPTSTLLFADMAYVNAVKQTVPGKSYMANGMVAIEELSKTGAADGYQLYAQLGLDFGSEKLHGTITGLAVA